MEEGQVPVLRVIEKLGEGPDELRDGRMAEEANAENRQHGEAPEGDHPKVAKSVLLPSANGNDQEHEVEEYQIRTAEDGICQKNTGKKALQMSFSFSRGKKHAGICQKKNPHRVIAESHNAKWRIN